MEKWFVSAKKADFYKIAEKFHISPVTARLIRNRDVIEDGKNGYVSENFGEFIDKIKKVIEDKNEKNNNIIFNAYNDVVNNYNVEIMVNKYKEAYLK